MSGSLMFWLVLAMVAIFLEMLTRTFTLITVALGFGTAALLSWMGFGVVGQVMGFLLVGGGAMLWLRRSDKGQELQEAEESRYSIMGDDGDVVHVSQWDTGDSVDITYRGRSWQAKLAKGQKAHRGLYRVREVREGKLVLEEKEGD
ncbi:MAG: hypothetical protein IPJ18_00915 [Betaproteobacteria bacterium]|nr:hypothetical protein [Betaproteobacteria bacterium]